jgi:hypothetical protein
VRCRASQRVAAGLEVGSVNYLAHAYRFLDRPLFVAGTALPDWMNVVDRKNRARKQYALPVLHDPNGGIAEFAAGVLQHHADDDWFHSKPEFVTLSSTFAVEVRALLAPGLAHQAAFVGHICVELLLDAVLIQRDASLLDRYYRLLDDLDLHLVQQAANRILKRPEDRLALLIPRFSQERFLADYPTDAGLLYRLNGVMKRVGLPPLPDLCQWLASARRRVHLQANDLLPPLSS